jgi:enamine deaminase RidA (YjgF/YER057c/UK114 family)
MRTSREIQHPGWIEWMMTLDGGISTIEWRAEVQRVPPGSVVLGVESFGGERSLFPAVGTPGSVEVPVCWIPGGMQAPRGVRLRCAQGGSLTPLLDDDLLVGHLLETDEAKSVFVTGLRSSNPSASRGVQTEELFQKLDFLLGTVGMSAGNLVRTWFFNDDILDWYEEFNRMRSAFYSAQSVSIWPASTCVGCASTSTIIADFIAIQPKEGRVTIQKIPSPLQGEASDYGSDFSRALLVRQAGTSV